MTCGDAWGGVRKYLLRHSRNRFVLGIEGRRFEAGDHFPYSLIEGAKGNIAAKRNRHDVAFVDFSQLSVVSDVERHSRGIPAQRHARHIIHGCHPAASPCTVVQQRAVFEVRIGISRRIIENQTPCELQTIFDGRIGSVVDKVRSVFDVVGIDAAGLILVKRVKPECLAKIFLVKTHNCSLARAARAQPASIVASHGNGARNAGHKADFGSIDPARFRQKRAAQLVDGQIFFPFTRHLDDVRGGGAAVRNHPISQLCRPSVNAFGQSPGNLRLRAGQRKPSRACDLGRRASGVVAHGNILFRQWAIRRFVTAFVFAFGHKRQRPHAFAPETLKEHRPVVPCDLVHLRQIAERFSFGKQALQKRRDFLRSICFFLKRQAFGNPQIVDASKASSLLG